MRYMVYIEIPTDVGNRLDFEEGGPGKLIGYVMEQFKPEAVYVEAGTRNSVMVAELNEAKMTELMVFVSKKFGTYPEFTPLIPAGAVPEIAGKAIEAVKQAP